MSTKIYNAYKNPDLVTTRQLGAYLQDLQKLRERMLDKAAEYLLKFVDWKNPKLTPFTDEMRKDMSSGMNSPFNFSASAVIYLHPKVQGTIVQFFGAHCSPFKALRKPLKGFKDWHYQNQTDRDGRISNKEWEQREREWDILLGNEGVPSLGGMSVHLISYEVMDHYEIPRRCRKLAVKRGLLKEKE